MFNLHLGDQVFLTMLHIWSYIRSYRFSPVQPSHVQGISQAILIEASHRRANRVTSIINWLYIRKKGHILSICTFPPFLFFLGVYVCRG